MWFYLTMGAVLLIAVETVLEKKTLSQTRSFEFAAMFAFGNAVVLTPFLLFMDNVRIDPFLLGVILLASFPSTGASFFVFKAIKHAQLSEVAPILALSPLVITLFAYWILGEKMSAIQLLGIFLMVGGMLVLELKNFKAGMGIFLRGRRKYIFYILLTLLLGGISAMFDRVLLSHFHVNPLLYVIYVQIFIAINYALFFLFRSHLLIGLKQSIRKSYKIILCISVLTVAHRYLHASAVQVAVSMGMVATVHKLAVLFHVFSGGKFFAEEGIFKKALAGVVILGGITLLIV